MPRQPGEVREKGAWVLVGHHPHDNHERTRYPFFQIAESSGGNPAAFRIVTAIEPYLASPRRLVQQLARTQTLHPRRPFGMDDAGFERSHLDPEPVLRAQRCDGETSIVELMTAEQLGRCQIHQPAVVLIHQPSALDIDLPFLPRPLK